MIIYPKVAGTARALHMGVLAAGLAGFLPIYASAKAATPAAIEAEKMVAASPQRERHRAWAMCVDHVANLVIAQGGNMEKVRSMIPLGCDEEESRLTGSLIAKYGYAQGNAAMRALKLSAENRFAAQIGRRDNPPRAPGFVEKTAEGWEVKRLDDGCVAIRFRRNSLNTGGSATALVRGMGVAKILLLLAGNDADMADKKSTRSFNVAGTVSGKNDNFNVALTLAPKPTTGGISYEVLVRDTLIAQLGRGEDLHIEVPTTLESSPTWSTRYPLNGIVKAWNAVERCVAAQP